jgi:hypothetical protein
MKKTNDYSQTELEKVYFTEDTENSIIKFNESSDLEYREIIFRKEIAKPLDKLAENIINRFKFPYLNNNFEDTKKQVVSFLVTNLSKYSKDKGKAFSYFSVIAKNYLIFHNNSGYKEEKRSFSIFEIGEEGHQPENTIGNLEAPDDHIHDDVKEFISLMIVYWENNVNKHFKKKRDIDIANAVIELFRRAEHIENFNKKALYLMIREITDCKTGYITKVVNKMRSVVKEHQKTFYANGSLKD